MRLTATHINYFQICHRKLWLFANGIQMEHTSENVAEGKLIGENSYPERAERYTEVEIDGIKIDFYDAKNKVVHEVKKSNKVEKAHIAQVKYYLYKLENHGIKDVSGVIEYPKLREREIVLLNDEDRETIKIWEKSCLEIIENKICPPLLNKPICKQCSYFDFCYVKEEL